MLHLRGEEARPGGRSRRPDRIHGGPIVAGGIGDRRGHGIERWVRGEEGAELQEGGLGSSSCHADAAEAETGGGGEEVDADEEEPEAEQLSLGGRSIYERDGFFLKVICDGGRISIFF